MVAWLMLFACMVRRILARRDTKIEAEGAELLVLGNLLIRGVESYKAYTNTPDYDLVALSANRRKTVTIQVKSRWDRSAKGFFLKTISADFVVAVFLNRSDEDDVPPDPDYFVLPKRILKKYWRDEKAPKVYLPDVFNLPRYDSAWELIVQSLQK